MAGEIRRGDGLRRDRGRPGQSADEFGTAVVTEQIDLSGAGGKERRCLGVAELREGGGEIGAEVEMTCEVVARDEGGETGAVGKHHISSGSRPTRAATRATVSPWTMIENSTTT